MRKFTYRSGGKITTYLGWDRIITSTTEFITLVRDEDDVDILAIDSPSRLQGVHEYVADNPCMEPIGIWKAFRPVARPVTDDRISTLFGCNNIVGEQVNTLLKQALSQDAYNELLEILT